MFKASLCVSALYLKRGSIGLLKTQGGSMIGMRRKRQDLDNQDQRYDRAETDTEMKQETAGVLTFSTQALKLSPCSSGKSASSEPGGPWNKGSVSRLRALSSETQSMTAELAMTSKIPHREKASLASRCNKLHSAWHCDEHRSAHAKDRVLNGSAHGEGSEQTQSRDILKSNNKMKHLFCKTNSEEITDCEGPDSAEALGNFRGGSASIKHLPAFDILSSESEEEEAGDDLLACWPDTYRETDLIAFPRAASQSSSASTTLSHSTHSLRSLIPQLSTSRVSGGALVNSDGYSVTPLLEQTRRRHTPPQLPIAYRFKRGFVACAEETDQHFPELQSGWRTSQMRFTPRTRFCQRQYPLVNMEEAAGQEGATATHILHCPKEALGRTTSEHQDSLDADEVMMLSSDKELVYHQECQAAEGGATAAQSLTSSSGEIAWRPKQRFSYEQSNEEEEEEQCRICHSGGSSCVNPLLSPCLCSGSMKFIHLDCLKKWIKIKIMSGSVLYFVKRCELCRGKLTLDTKTLDLDEYYKTHHKKKKVNITEMYHFLEAADLLTFRSTLSRAVLPAMVATPCPLPRVRIWLMLPYMIRRRLRRIRERRNNPPPEAPDT